ncbi:transcriptional regulator, LysR family [Novosphingobium pentaromativorans US6-1]|uniref:Transcriptional regulator, LysR family n=1 Tax=Novosphingobium pentaromativorans US6-1 TaxID=1088721 RepID=G6EFW4_9SPHN|nr:transcriptional regulator, LysR family [Novosphingobium pentaromativorans US6-1]
MGVAKLERLLGHALFVRSNQRVELTDAGSRLLAHARRIEREFNLAQQAMEPASALPSLRLGALSSIPAGPIAAAIAGVRPQETYRFELVFGSERELASQLAKGRIDLALTLVDRGAERFLERRILNEGYVLAMPRKHALAGMEAIDGEQLVGEVMIVRRHCEALSDVSRHFTERGVRPHFSLRSTNDERVLEMVAAGLGITVMPESYVHQGVAKPRLSGFSDRRTVGWMAGHHAEHLLAGPGDLIAAIEAQLHRTHELA